VSRNQDSHTRAVGVAELARLDEDARRVRNWKRWGPYLSERQWGTVREDYSPHGSAWSFFTHDQSRARAYRWGEDGIGGICDRHQYVCFAIALWNERDPILKERLFGLTAEEGNHGEDVKELYFYLDSTPTHSYMRFLYKYPQQAFPYAQLVEESRRRGRDLPEYEILDTGVFDGGRYFDVEVEYAKRDPEDLLIRITATNRGPEAAPLHVLPTIWFRNTWSWGLDARRPAVRTHRTPAGGEALEVDHWYYGPRWLFVDTLGEQLFTNNDSNWHRLFGGENPTPHVKDAFHDYVVHGAHDAVSPHGRGTKAAFHHVLRVEPGAARTIRLRLCDDVALIDDPAALGAAYDELFTQRRAEADEFYSVLAPRGLSGDGSAVMRQSFAGLLWSKQFYAYDVSRWLSGDPDHPEPPAGRLQGRNADWTHLFNEDVISMPDKWEYPWYAAWDLAFHCIPISLVDPDFAKQQLILLLREWYMHPNGQLPAYEWNFADVNPPVHAWAAWRVYKIEAKRRGGVGDRSFLERVFHKLLLNFTWWVNRKDAAGRNVFQGGFLGLDNIGVFDRSAPLPTGGHIEQSDATSWMGMYCLNMLQIALELAREDRAYEDVASKFFEHFVYICHAMNNIGGGVELWDKSDGFFYDVLSLPDGRKQPLKVRSLVGLIPLYAVESLDSALIDRLPGFKRRMQWFIENRPELSDHVQALTTPDLRVLRLLALVGRDRLRQVLHYMLDENEFLSPFGVRALSRYHLEHPYLLEVDGTVHRVDYEPGESRSHLFGGNSNWRGPVWFPVNFLLIEALQRYHFFFGDDFKVEFPTGSGVRMNLWQIAAELSRRLLRIFVPDADGVRPCLREMKLFRDDPHFRDLLLFHEYFHGETGAGVGANHQTGWTALIAKLIQQSGE
jgi:hypothetical protein